MYDEDELSLLDSDEALESPLDKLPPVTDPPEEEAGPDVEELLGLLASSDKTQRMIAIRAFCEVKDPRATAPLIELLSNECPLVRVSAAYALGRNPGPRAVQPLIDQLNQDWNGYVRKGVVWALGNCSDPQAIRPLIAALMTDITAVRLWAASSLGQVGLVEAEAYSCVTVPALASSLEQDPMAAVRSNCAWSLGQLCQAIPVSDTYQLGLKVLIAALKDRDLGVQEDAKAALLKLGDPRGLQALEDLEPESSL
ncbi:HEAT repeat domain-containing protein [Lyngbya confervoides]|uniref:HEAT repeat domain-containing protein n=1 Tax=Lyngbya confervoides BDU141951 TaxID=1574623 RepID=A0ABD4T1Y4_9CYAN|nr:HEAT repeat domain-containing protein [Lyngbya confervoides]MCM1982659.1 HEAT repeat domain-containing protein [Lyngbya confervoides BDU141951]